MFDNVDREIKSFNINSRTKIQLTDEEVSGDDGYFEVSTHGESGEVTEPAQEIGIGSILYNNFMEIDQQ